MLLGLLVKSEMYTWSLDPIFTFLNK